MSFLIQALVLALVAGLFLNWRGRLSTIQIAVMITWFAGVSVIYLKYGSLGQLTFYQNDQELHWRIVMRGYSDNFNLGFQSLNYLRLPFTLPALLLSKIGFDATLSIKAVSLFCALATNRLIERHLASVGIKFSVTAFWIIAGPMTTFFSILALRETMMMLCVTQLYIGASTGWSSVSLLTLLILRPHLGAAVVFGKAWGWLFSRVKQGWYLPFLVATSVLPIYFGTFGYAIGNLVLHQRPLRLDESLFLKDQIIQVFSAFIGAQFLTVPYQTVEFSTRSLIAVRVIFPEIVFVPFIFVVCCAFFVPQLTKLRIGVLGAFVFFTAVSSGTEFLSVRQSLPMMPVMGLAVLLTVMHFKQVRADEKSPAELQVSDLNPSPVG